ncbi:MAG TPA: hypothetical protein VIH51_08510, partial [Myxococcales bacterium]
MGVLLGLSPAGTRARAPVEDLPKDEFRVCRVTVVNGAAKINLAEARRVAGPVQKAPHYCGAWVTVSVAGIAKA